LNVAVWSHNTLIGLASVALVVGSILTVRNSVAEDQLTVPTPISVIATNAAGDVMVEASPGISNEWTAYEVGDSLELERGFPLSLGWSEPKVKSSEGVSDAVVKAQVIIKRHDATTSCPYPAHPSQALFMSTLEDGTVVILRMPTGSNPASVKIHYLEKDYRMQQATPEEVARVQTSGNPPDVDWSTSTLEAKVSVQDNFSLVAFLDKSNQKEMLNNTAELMAEILELYYTRNGTYPRTMCQLYTGSKAVITAIPRNPFFWSRNLCATEDAPPRPRGCIKYFAERVGQGTQNEASTGYWLAVTGDGKEVDPTRPLPPSAPRPFRVIRWIEQHHDPVV
jgi:hypothetical protein